MVIHSIDLHTAKKSELCFRDQYYFRTNRSGGIDGFALFFKVFFEDLHKPLTFTTEPKAKRSKWRQTVFFFNNTVWANKDTEYYGNLNFESINKDTNNPDLNRITVTFEMLTKDSKHDNVVVSMIWNMP